MNIKNGQKFGLTLLINRIKNNILIISLIIVFVIWILLEVFYIYSSSQFNQDIQSDSLNKISGIAKVIDGDSIIVSNKYEVRLINIDAPEYNQKCLNKNNHEYFCGKMAKNFVYSLVEGKKLVCYYKKKDIYQRFLANCYLNNKNINNELLKNGMAIIYSFNEVEDNLYQIENSARSKKIGIWQGSFLEPSLFRKQNK